MASVTLSQSAPFLKNHEERQHAPTVCAGGDFFRRCPWPDFLSIGFRARGKKKRGAFAPRSAMSEVQVSVVPASAATMKPSTTVKPSTAMEASATIVPAAGVAHGAVRAAITTMIEAAVSMIASRATIGTVIVVSKVMLTAAPAMPVGTEVMVVAAIVANRSPTNEEGRIETPAERAVEDSVSRSEGVAAEIRIPIPTGGVPASHRIGLRAIDVGFRSIRGPQAAPAVEIVLALFFVEFFGFRCPLISERELMPALDFDIPVQVPNDGLALVNAEEVAIGVEIVQAGLEKTLSVAVFHDDQIILFMKLRNFDAGAALVQPKFRVGQAGRNH